MLRRSRRAAPLAAFATLAALAGLEAAPAAARERIDFVRLKNGDQISCEIIDLRSGYLNVRTRSFGTVDIERDDLAALVSVQYFEVELADGRRLVATLDEGSSPGHLGLHVDQSAMTEVAFAEVFQIRQLGATFWASRRGRLNLGLDFGSSGDETNFSLDARVTYQRRRLRSDNNVQATSSSHDDADAKERVAAWSDLEVPIGRIVSFAGRASYERNSELELDSRLTASAALLGLPWRSDRGRFAAGAGVAQSEEEYASAGAHSATMGLVYVDFDAHRFGPYGTEVSAQVVYLIGLSGASRHRVEGRGSLTQKIASDLNIALTPYYSFDSRTPVEGIQNEDWGFISSIGWTF
jgi:hypothetical protein